MVAAAAEANQIGAEPKHGELGWVGYCALMSLRSAEQCWVGGRNGRQRGCEPNTIMMS